MAGRNTVLGTWLLVALIVLAGCADADAPDAAGEPGGEQGKEMVVYVVNYPLQYFAERIGEELVRVEFPTPADVDPAFWRPAAEQISDYQKADLVLLNGAGYAQWINSASLPSASLVDTSAAFHERLIVVENVATHAHGPQGEHEHGGVAFTTWLDVRLAMEQARSIEAAFREALPAGAETFRSGLELLERDLLELDDALRRVVEGRDLPLLGSHPVYQYLAKGYGLEIESVHFEPDEFPADAAWKELRAFLEERPARWMLWEGSPLERTANRLQELGVGSIVFNPCGNRPEEGDFLTVQRGNIENLRGVFTAGS